MQRILEDIKNKTFRNAYLFYGSEAYLKHQYRQNLVSALTAGEDMMNFSKFEGKGINIREVIDLAETMPFFSERRVILIEQSGFFKNKCDELAEYLPTLPDYLCMIFVEDEVDKRSRTYKALLKQGIAVEFNTPSKETLEKWILTQLKAAGKNITRANMELFLEMTGMDMSNIRLELDKLISYTLPKTVIETKDIETVCSAEIPGQIFDMISAVTEKNQKRALELYYDLLFLKEPPLKILVLLSKEFNTLLQICELLAEGHPQKSIAGQIGMQDFAVRKRLPIARRYEIGTLRQAVEDCVEMDEAVKTGRIEDTLSVELLIIKYST